MKRSIFTSVLFLILLFVSLFPASASDLTDKTTPSGVVLAFQKIPPYEIFCQDEKYADWEPVKIGSKFETYLGQEFFKLFLWTQCRKSDANAPPFYADLDNLITWDFRFGDKGSGYTSQVTNIRIKPVKYQGNDKVVLKLLFDIGILKNITTTYTLIRESGHWKIDDIAPKGDYVEEGDQEPFLEHSDSIKTDMQTNYNAAMERYKKEQAKKGAVPKK